MDEDISVEDFDKIKYCSTCISINKSIKLFRESLKPELDIVSFFGKVGYLDEKVTVYKFPIYDKNKYKHIYKNYILYYKHVVNSDLERKGIEPYKAYICFIENGIRKFDIIPFTKLFKILNLIYNKESIIKHIKYITYGNFDITNLLN